MRLCLRFCGEFLQLFYSFVEIAHAVVVKCAICIWCSMIIVLFRENTSDTADGHIQLAERAVIG